MEAGEKERYTVPFMLRLSPRQVERLDGVLAHDPAFKGRQEVIRRIIDVLLEDDLSAKDAPFGAGAALDSATAERVIEALSERTSAYNDLKSQVRAIGHNVNQIARALNAIAQLGVGSAPSASAFESVAANIASAEDRLAALASQDSFTDSLIEDLVRGSSGR